MKKDIKQFAVALYETTKQTPATKLPSLLKNFVQLLADQRMLSKADQIINGFKNYYNQQEGIAEITIESANPLGNPEKNQIIKELQTLLKKKIEIHEVINENLIGGLVLKFDDLIVDASLNQRLKNLRKNLVQS